MQVLTTKQKIILLNSLNRRIENLRLCRAEWAHDHFRANLFNSVAEAREYWDLDNPKALEEIQVLAQRVEHLIYTEAV